MTDDERTIVGSDSTPLAESVCNCHLVPNARSEVNCPFHGVVKAEHLAEYVAGSMQKMDDPYAIGRAVQKAIQDSTDATDGDVGRFLRSLREQGYYVARSRRQEEA